MEISCEHIKVMLMNFSELRALKSLHRLTQSVMGTGISRKQDMVL